ncbi:MAG: AMP-binding protein [Alphaproteobacteria bacterium]|nr:AMP-binding protein [Alphaproteobacteria bacterium]
MPLTFGDLLRRHAATWPEHPAYVSFDGRVTWAELKRRTDALGHALKRAGIRPGDRVAMLAADCIEVAELFLACARIGAVRVGFNARLAGREIAQLLDDSSPDLLFVQAGYEPLARAALRAARHAPAFIGFGGQHGFAADYADWLAAEARSGPLQDTPGDIAMLCYTTGSTGSPKGAIYPHQQMLRSILYIALSEGAVHDDVWLHAMPAGGVPIIHMLRNIFHGSTTAIVGPWEAERALALMARERTTICVLVPTMLSSLLGSGLIDRYDRSSMRLLGYGASPLPPATIREAMAAFGCPFLQMYGTTELMGMSAMLFPSDHRRGLADRPEILASAGRSLPWVDTRIVDDEGRDVPVGETGEVIVRSELTIPGYWNAPEKYAETVRDGWLFTGDMGRRDEEGYLYLGDRAKFRIKTGGYNVFPTEVENVLAEHPAVHEVSVFGLPDPTWGERIHAVVSLKPGQSLDLEAARAFCQGKIANFKLPKSLAVWPELPKGATGKILKRQIMECTLAEG